VAVKFARKVLGLALFGSLLVGCGAAPSGAIPQAVSQSGVHRAGGSSGDLIYANREEGNVVIVTYPGMKTVTRFNVPNQAYAPNVFGICSDTSGNVFITANYITPYAGNIYEYSHGATNPFATLSVAKYFQAYDCSYDSGTGNLAVADYSHGYGYGGVSIFANEQGQPTVYTVPNMGFPEYVGYNDKGDLFASGGNTQTGACVFAELPKGSSTFNDVTLPYGLGCSGRIQWDGKYITMQDRRNYVINRLSISGSTASIVGTTTLKDVTKVGMGESWFDAKHSHLVVPEGHFTRVLGDYAYPRGGKAVKADAHTHEVLMWSATISVGQ
jgi:hypothetical protein